MGRQIIGSPANATTSSSCKKCVFCFSFEEYDCHVTYPLEIIWHNLGLVGVQSKDFRHSFHENYPTMTFDVVGIVERIVVVMRVPSFDLVKDKLFGNPQGVIKLPRLLGTKSWLHRPERML
jgi:hypothetical protein